MAYRVDLHEKATQELASLPRRVQRDLGRIMRSLAADPYPPALVLRGVIERPRDDEGHHPPRVAEVSFT